MELRANYGPARRSRGEVAVTRCDAPTIDNAAGDLMPDRVTILLVEDNPDDATLTELALRNEVPASLEVARDGQEALDYLLNEANDLPRLVLLDLKLPNVDGLEVLRRIREHERTCLTPVVILTSSGAPSDVAAAYRNGASSYVRKPVDFDHFAAMVRQIGSYWLRVNEPPSNSGDQ
jgi:two-component system, response regulator